MTKPVVTFIHGTFERRASWTRQASPLRQAIADQTGAVTFRRRVWRGTNTFQARHEGVERLEEHMQKMQQAHPGAPHFLVSHSHGGSVVAYWLKRSPANVSRIGGAVFVSTPFVAVRPAVQSRLHAALMAWWPVAVFGMAIGGFAFALLCWLARVTLDVGSGRTSEVGTMVGVLLGGALASSWYLRHRKDLRKYASAEGRPVLADIAQAHSTCDLPRGPYLFLKTTSDEVISGLGAAQLINQIAERVQLAANWFADKVMSTIGKFSAAIALFVLIVAATWFAELPSLVPALWRETPTFGEFVNRLSNAAYGHWWARAYLVFVVGLLGMIALVIALWLTNVAIGKALLMAFGDIPAVEAAFLDCSVEPLPYGSWEVHHVRWEPTQTGLHHSAGYSSPAAIEAITRWMRGRLDQAIPTD